MKLSDYVIQRVAEEVRHIFLLPGGGSMHLVDSVARAPGLEFVCNLHEQACAIAAEAYGQYTNRLGVALVTTGPGGTNTVTGVAAAWLDSTPCLFLSGQVKRSDLCVGRGVRQMGFQEINIIDIVRPITKYAVTVTDPTSIRYHLEKALFLARAGRPGPVWLDIPLDVQAARIDPAALRVFDASEVAAGEPRDLGDQVRQAIRLLNEAERPVVLAGNGVRLAGALDRFLELIRILDVPVLTTWKALDFLAEDDPLYVGRPGAVGQRAANFAQQNADWLLSVGARLDLGQTAWNHANFARAARKIILEIDPAELGKLQMPIDVPVSADAGRFLDEFLSQRARIAHKDRRAWWSRCRGWKQQYPVLLPSYWQEAEGVSNYALVEVLSREMAPEDILVPGSSGACSEVTMQAFQVKRGMRVLNSEGLGPMGFGLAASIGGCLAGGRRRTICIEGDGGLQLNSQELETLHRLDLPIKLFVLNNGGYGSIQATQRHYFEGRLVASSPESGLTLPDTLALAAAYRLPGERISGHGELREKVRQVLAQPGPVVCEVMICAGQTTMPRVASIERADGSIASGPMEDLWPFLDREEFRENMLIPPVEEDAGSPP